MTPDVTGRDDRTLPTLPAGAVVSVVVPARQAAAHLDAMLTSVLRQHPPVHEVVVAAADVETAEAARAVAVRDARVVVVDNPAGGTSAALNRAAARAVGDVLVRVDTHCILPDGYISTAVDALRRTGAANVGGRQVPAAREGLARAVALAMGSVLGSGGATYRVGGGAGPTDTVYLGVFRREALDAVGGFDEVFVRNQDAELNQRLRAAGFEVWFEPSLEVAYEPRGSVRALAVQYAEYGRWRRATLQRHRTGRARQLAAPLLVVGLLGLGVVSAVARTPLPLIAGLGAYAGVLLGVGLALARRPVVGLRTALALATMHVSWGLGFLWGPPRGFRSGSRRPRPRSDA